MSIYNVERGEKLDGTPCAVVDLGAGVRVRIPIDTAAQMACDIWAVVCQAREEPGSTSEAGTAEATASAAYAAGWSGAVAAAAECVTAANSAEDVRRRILRLAPRPADPSRAELRRLAILGARQEVGADGPAFDAESCAEAMVDTLLRSGAEGPAAPGSRAGR